MANLCLNGKSLIDKFDVNHKSVMNDEMNSVLSDKLMKNVQNLNEIDEKMSKVIEKNGGNSVAVVDNIVSVAIIDKNKQKLNEKIVGLNNKQKKDTQLAEDISQEDEDCRKKRRCADRYDSSESSDSGVATLSCTDSSTTSSDTSDPGSPYSPSSVCEDTQQQQQLNTKSKAATNKTKTNTIISNNNNNNNKMAPHTQTTNLNSKPHQWPWINANNTAAANNVTNLNLNKLKRSQQTQQSDKSNNTNGIKRIRSTSTDKKSNTSISINNKKITQMAIVSATNINQISGTTTTITKNIKNITATNDVTNGNKITGYFKSQIKTTNTMNNLKKNIKNLAGRATTTTTAAAAEITSTTTTTTELLTTTATVLQQKSIIKTATTGAATVKGTNGSLEKYLNLLQQQQLAKTINKPELDVRTLTTTIMPSLKKVERKTARVAPTVSLARKVNNTQGALGVGQPKKPVTIAPRTAEPKINLTYNQQIVATAASSASISQEQIMKSQQPTVLLTAIRIPQHQQNHQQFKQQQITSPPRTPTKLGSTVLHFHHQPTAVMPNLVQIPNLVPTQATNGNKLTTTTSTTTASLLMNNNGLTTARLNNGTTQLFMNGAVIKLQQMETNSLNMNLSNMLNKSPTISSAVPFTTTTTLSTNQQNKTYTLHPQQHIFQQANQQYAQQQLFMTPTGSILLNTSALPTMLAQQLLSQQTNIPALHPLQPNQPQSQPNGATMLPNITALLQSQQQNYHHHQILANIPQSVLTNLHASKIPQPHPFSTSTMVPISSHVFITSTPSMTVTSNTTSFTTPISISTTCAPTTISHPLSPPPLVATIQSQYTNTNTNFNLNAPKLIIAATGSCNSSGTPTTAAITTIPPHSITTEPPKLVPVKLNIAVDTAKVKPSFAKTQMKPQLNNPLTLDCGSSSDSGVAVSSENEMKSSTTIIVDLCSPTIPLLSPKEKDVLKIVQHLQCQKSPKSLVLERIKQKKPPELMIDEPSESKQSTPIKAPPNIETEFQTASLPECAKSPILSQPKTIRFPASNGTHCSFGRKGFRKSSDGRLYGVCYWNNCTSKFDTSSKLLDHLQIQHVNAQTGPFSCLWDGCKVYNRESCSRRWLDRHVLLHGGTKTKPFKCIVGGCGLRFGSHLALEKHVNCHFNNSDNTNSNKRSSDPPVPKLLRKNGKKLRYRRQPWSARRFDFFDAGVMEGLQHRLIMTGSLASGPRGAVCFKGRPSAKRISTIGVEVLVQWSPSNIIVDEWMPEVSVVLTKQVSIYDMSIEERIELESYLKINREANSEMLNDIKEINIKQEEEQKVKMPIVFNSRTSPKKLRKPLRITTTTS